MIASSEQCLCPPRVVRRVACQAAIASSVNQTVKLPRWRKLASYARQFVTLNRCLGMWWRQEGFALNGTGHPGEMLERSPTPACSCCQPPIAATTTRPHLDAVGCVASVLLTGVDRREIRSVLQHRYARQPQVTLHPPQQVSASGRPACHSACPKKCRSARHSMPGRSDGITSRANVVLLSA